VYAYHIDRSCSNHFQDGDILTISPTFTDYNTNKLLESTYNNKLTRHGQQYLVNPINPTNPWNTLYETIFEYERRINFPQLPSRFQSFFATQTLEDVDHWIGKLNLNEYIPVWKVYVDPNKVFKADASWFNLDNFDKSTLRISYNALQYWYGKFKPDFEKEPELLIKESMKLIERIN